MPNPLEALGLELNTAGRTVELAHGVVLHFRPPEGPDWNVARTRAQEQFQARDMFASACARYGLSTDAVQQLLDPDRWDEASVFFTACELAPLIVSKVARQVDGPSGPVESTVPASLEVFRVLFKQGDSLDRFWNAAREADRELILPKKGSTPSPSTSLAAGANTAEGAGASVPAPKKRSARRTAPKG